MTEFRGAPRFRAMDYITLRLTAVAAVITGVVLLALAAFLLSYAGIHELALAVGVSPRLAGLYPLSFDAMLVVACVAVLALRGAEWWMQCFAWLSILVLLTAVAIADATHAAGITLPRQPTAAAMAAVPWVLVLLGLGIWLTVLRHLRAVGAAGERDHHRSWNRSANHAATSGQMGNQRPAGDSQSWRTGRRPPGVDVASPQPRPETSDARLDEADTPDVRVIPAQPEPHTTDPDPGTPDVRVIPAQPDAQAAGSEPG